MLVQNVDQQWTNIRNVTINAAKNHRKVESVKDANMVWFGIWKGDGEQEKSKNKMAKVK